MIGTIAGRCAIYAALPLLALAACHRTAPPPDARASGDPLDAVALPLPAPAAPPPGHSADEKTAWRAMPDGGAGFGYAGERPLLTLTCRAGLVVVTRNVAAPVGAQALFPLIGNGRILRLPVDAVGDPSGRGGYVWRGSFAPDDPAREVFMGGALTGTLPGGGEIRMTGSPLVREVIEGCAHHPATAAPISAATPE